MNMSKKEYNRYVTRLAQKSPLGKDLLRSFLVGGLICVIGQLILNGFTALDLSEQDAAHGRKCEGQKAHADDGDGLYT